MRTVGDRLAETYSSWLSFLTQCCPALAPGHGEESPTTFDQPIKVLQDQPALVPPPSYERTWPSTRQAYPEQGLIRNRTASIASHFSGRRGLWPSQAPRRPQISAPTNFRHVYSEAFDFPPAPPRPRSGARFRPLELSIYMPDNHLSPILPHIAHAVPELAAPPPAHTNAPATAWDDNSVTLTHERSTSSMSFHIPRRHELEGSSFQASEDGPAPRIPPRARARAYTSPSVERIVERIACAMIEKDRLQAEIDSVIERSSIYISSRPSTAYGLDDFEAMPSIPALPAAAPSFAERFSIEDRPRTAPAQPIHIPQRQKSFAEASAAFHPPIRQVGDELDRPLAPPLPLVLRPPLRKKKSFSRVSSWLFPGAEQQQEAGVGSVTNQPKPITGREGFYQCVAPPEAGGRGSPDSEDLSNGSSWGTEEAQTVPTTWSPGSPGSSSRFTKHGTPESQTPIVDRKGTFGRGAGLHRPTSVGVAF